MKKNSFFKNGIRILTGGRLFGGEPLLGKMVARQGILSLEDAVISGSLDVRDNVTGSFFTGSFVGDGTSLTLTSSQITDLGNLSVSGSIIPDTGNVFDLGSLAKPWRDLYLSGSTLYLGNTKFTRNQDGDVELTDSQQVRKKIIVDSVELRRGDKTVVLNVDSGSGQLSTLDATGEPLVITTGDFSGSFRGDGENLTGIVNNIAIPIGNSNGQYNISSFNLFTGSVDLRAGSGLQIYKDASKIVFELTTTALEAIENQSSVNVAGSTSNNLVLATSTSSLEGEASLSFDNGTLFVTGTVSASYFSGDGSGLYNIPISRLTGSYRIFDFTEITASTFTHNLNTTHPLVQVYDSGSNQIMPQTITAVDSSSVYISFGDFVETGHIIIGAGGDIIDVTNNITQNYITGSDTFTASFSGTTSYSIVHNFNTENVIVSVYDQNKSYFLPSTMVVTNPNQVDLTFTTPMSGYAVVAKAGHVVSGSVQNVDWNAINNIPSGLFSSSAQVVIYESQIADLSHYTDSDVKSKLNQENVISSSAQIASEISGAFTEVSAGLDSRINNISTDYADITNKPIGIVSGSSQITDLGTLTISGSLLPSTNEVFDLGSAQNRWRDLYLSGSTLYLGDTKITRTSTGDIEFKDSSNNRKKLIADSIELRKEGKVVKLELDAGGSFRQTDTSTATAATTAGNFSGSFTGSFIGDGSQLSGVTSYTNSDTLTYINSLGVISGSGQLTTLGNITLSGSIIPAVDNTYDLGSPTRTWRDVYISSGSLYIDGTKVLSSTSDVLTITTDVGQSLKILESGADDITLQTDTGNIELKGTVEILSGKKILDSAGTQVVVGDNLSVEGNITLTGTVDNIDLQSFSSSIDSRIDSINTSVGNISTDFGDITNKPTLISSSNQLAGQTIDGNLTVGGILTAQEFRAEFIESAIIYESGSTKFGNSSDDVHQLTGSVCVAGTVSATSFTGDGSGLTGVTSYTDSDTLTYINSKGVVSGSTQIDYNSIQNKPTIPTNNSQLTNGCGYTTCTGTVTSVGGTGTVNGISLSGTVSSTGDLTLGGTLSGITVSQLAGGAVQTSAEAFSDSNTVLMTAAAIADKIESYGYCTTDTNTTYTAGTMLSCISAVDGAGSGLDADLLDGQQGSYYLDYNNFTNKPTIPTNNNQLTNGAGYTTCTGTVTSVGGTGTVNGITLSGTVSSTGNLTLGGTLSGITVSQLAGGAVQTSAEAFSDSNTVLMTAAAIADKIESYGYCTTDTNTTYSATTMLSCISSVDGAGSGLDADLLDGQQGSYYLDYNNFSNKPTVPTNTNQLTNGAGYTTCTGTVGGSGTSGYISKWNGSTSQTNSIIYDNGTNVGIGTTNPSNKLEVNGTFYTNIGNTSTGCVLFEHEGSNNPVPFSLRKTGYAGNSDGFGILHLDMNHSCVGGGSNLYFRLLDSAGNWTEYAGIGGVISDNTNGSEDGDLQFYNISGGSNRTVNMKLLSNGDLIPGANGTQNLGSSTLRWNTVYTSDLSLKNDVGDWTIVEGEEDLFLYNNKKDKVYKFNLTEVDKDSAPKKRS